MSSLSSDFYGGRRKEAGGQTGAARRQRGKLGLEVLRRARAQAAVSRMRRAAAMAGTANLDAADIDAEVREARSKRRTHGTR